jgi:hypothetical protein
MKLLSFLKISSFMMLVYKYSSLKFKEVNYMQNNISSTLRIYLAALLELFLNTYLEAIVIMIAAFFIGYLLAGTPDHVPWLKLIPTLLIAFPVYESRSSNIATWGGESPMEKIDAFCFKAIYVVGITWLTWDIFKGII